MKTKYTRDFYINKSYTKYTPELGDYPANMFECYVDLKTPAAQFFIGKQSAPAWSYRFSSVDRMKEHINKSIKNLMAREESKIARKEKMHQPSILKEGDILYTSWGYEQTNVDFYQVTKILGERMVEIREIWQTRDTTDMPYDQGHCIPVKDSFKDSKPLKKVVKHGNTVNIASYANAWLWDGKPCRYSTYG